ncbi:MAG: hypothetical protein ACFFCO_11665, partial [Promethearchaeota archaeon]
IAGADISVLGGLTSQDYARYDYNNGTYTIQVFPPFTGSYDVTFQFWAPFYQNCSLNYHFEVVRMQLEIQLVDVEYLEILEGMPLELSIMLCVSHTNESVVGATVEYSIEGQTTISGQLTDMGGGIYSVTIAPGALPYANYQVKIRVPASQFYNALEFSTTLVVTLNAPARTAQISATVILIILLLFTLYISGRQIRKRQRAILLKKLAVRQRFVDARNILSVLVIHQATGLPILSTQMREDVPSELVAGFISAIRHFRQQVALREEELLQVFPISDVVHISPTRNTLCGLVTLLPPSPSLLEKLKKYSIIINNEFDNLLEAGEEEPVEYGLPKHLIEALEACYDLQLLAPYVSAFDSSTPRKFRKLVRVCQQRFADQNINLYELVQELTRRGAREENAYDLVLQAITAGYLVRHPKVSPLDQVAQLKTPSRASAHEPDQSETEGGMNDS